MIIILIYTDYIIKFKKKESMYGCKSILIKYEDF